MKELSVIDGSGGVAISENFGLDAGNVAVHVGGLAATNAQSAIEEIAGQLDDVTVESAFTRGVIVDGVGELAIDMGNIKAGTNIDRISVRELLQAAYGDKNRLTVMHLSDTHGDAECIQQCVAEAKRDSDIEFIICTGDIGDNAAVLTAYNAMKAADCEQPVLGILGNHDMKDMFGHIHADATAAMAEINGNNVVWGATENGAPTNSYWHKDVTTEAGETIRFIALNDYDDSNGAAFNYQLNYTYEQMLWLYNLLMATPSSHYIVIIKHEPVQNKVNQGNLNNWTYSTSSSQTSNAASWIPQIMNAYINRSVFSGSFRATYRDELNFSITMDFRSLHASATFICYLCGHTHSDWHAHLDAPHHSQLMLCVTASNKNVYKNAWYADNDRGVAAYNGISTVSYIANKVTFDLGLRQVLVERFGSPYLVRWNSSTSMYEPNPDKIRHKIVFSF